MIKRNNLVYNISSINEYGVDKNIKQPIRVAVKDVRLITDYKLNIIYDNGATKNIELINNSIKKFEYVSEGNKIIIETNNNDKFEIEIPIDGSKWELVEGLLRTKDGAKITLHDISEIDSDLGAEDKFLNEKGEFATIQTSSIGVTGSELYMSTQNSDVAGYKLLSNTIDVNETEITLTANSSQDIVWGNKYLTPEYTATTIPSKSWGFDYWRKVSSSINNSTKHLRVFIYRGGIETDIISLTSPDINDTDFVERQVVYTLGAIELQQGDRIGVQDGFSTMRNANVTLTYIIGDGRGWFMRVPFAISHKDTTDKNGEPNFQHVTQEEKDLISSTATVVNGHTEDILNLQTNKANKATTLSGYGITDAVTAGSMAIHVASSLHLTEEQIIKLNGIEAGAEVNVNADWNASSGDAQILNKPTSMPASDVYAWAKASTKPTYNASEIGGLDANYRWLTDAYITTWNDKEPAIVKLTAFNKNFGTTAGTVSEGNHTHTFASLTSKPNTLSGYAITDAYTKTEIDAKIAAVFRYKGSIPTYIDLTALTGMTVGDVYNITETGDNYAWTGTEWDKLSGEIDLSAYLTIADASNTYETKANVNLLANIVSGHTEDISDLQANKADKATTLSGYGITDAYTKTEIDTNFENHKTYSNVTREDLIVLINNNELVPNSSYRITDYTTTTAQTDTTSSGHDFDIIVTALSTNELSEIASCVRKTGDTYFTNDKLEAWKIKYCIDNNTTRFAWADAVNGKGVIYYMKDEWGNECPYDFKNIQFNKSGVYLYTFGGTTDNSLTGGCHHNIMMEYTSSSVLTLNFNTIGNNCQNNTFGHDCYSNTFGNYCYSNTFGNYCYSNTFGNNCFSNSFGDNCYSNTFGIMCSYNTFGIGCTSNTFGDNCYSNTFSTGCSNNTFGDNCYNNSFGDYCYTNTFGTYCQSNKFGTYCQSNTFGHTCQFNTFDNSCQFNTFGNSCSSNTFSTSCYGNTFGNNCTSNTFGDNCQYNNFYTGTSGATKKDYLRYIVLEDGCSYNNFYSSFTTGSSSYLQRIRIKGLQNTSATNTQITLSATNTNYEWVIAKNSSGVVKQYCPEDSSFKGNYDTETVSAPANGGTLTLKNATETVISTILTNSNSFTIALPTAIDGKVKESILIFKIGATLPALTQPSGVVYRTETPVIAINQTWTFCYERVSFDGGSTYEIYVSATKNV